MAGHTDTRGNRTRPESVNSLPKTPGNLKPLNQRHGEVEDSGPNGHESCGWETLTLEDVFGPDSGDEGQRAMSGASETSTVAKEDRGLSQEMVTEEGCASRGTSAPHRVCKKGREEHERTHLPYRSWFDICVKARGRRLAHTSKSQRGAEDVVTVPRISFDYFYMNIKDQRDGTNPLIIVVDECIGEKYARQVERKGVGDDGVIGL